MVAKTRNFIRYTNQCDWPVKSKFSNLCFRAEIQRRLHDALLQDVELSNRKNVEQLLWKSAFYQVIEMLRHKISEGGEDDAKQELLTVIDEVLEPSFLYFLTSS